MGSVESFSDGFSIPDERADYWARAAIVGRAWAAAVTRGEDATQLQATAAEVLAQIQPLEGFFAFPGPRLMHLLQQRLLSVDAAGFFALAQRINGGLASGAYRHDTAMWEPGEEVDDSLSEYLPPALDGHREYRPYFEVLSGRRRSTRARYEQNRRDMRRLRRVDDPFVYEVLHVNSFRGGHRGRAGQPRVAGNGHRRRLRLPLAARDVGNCVTCARRARCPSMPNAVDVREYGLKLAWHR
jgi:hypothetical protein